MRSAFSAQPADVESWPDSPMQRRPVEDLPVVEVVARMAVRRDRAADVSANLTEQLLALAARTSSPDVEIHVDFGELEQRPAQEVPRLQALPDTPEPKLKIMVPSRIVFLDGVAISLTRLEFDLLLFLCETPGRVFQRGTLLHAVWGFDHVISTRTVDVHVRRLRRKLGTDLDLITTVRGVGYRVDNDEDVRIEYGTRGGQFALD